MERVLGSLSSGLDSMRSKPSRVYFFNLLLSLSPFLGYLLVFKNYIMLREATGMNQITSVSTETLPAIDRIIGLGHLPHKVVSAYTSPFLDILAAIPYLFHFPLPLVFAGYLIASKRRRRDLFGFLWCAGWVNFIGVIIQFIFPCAPPWFVDTAVYSELDGHLVHVGNNEAGFQRLDELMGSQMFHNIYGASPVKFGAMPSLHVAWPAVILFCKPWVSTRVGVFHVAWLVWAALYSNHHFAIDAIAGILLALVVNLAMLRIWSPFPPVSLFRKDEDERPVLPM
eukprot:m.115152 g.115152  ORF g.115152 m.115152 type:complete len:283 (+) comp16329_c0_seq1:125-973(+)